MNKIYKIVFTFALEVVLFCRWPSKEANILPHRGVGRPQYINIFFSLIIRTSVAASSDNLIRSTQKRARKKNGFAAWKV